ncbi:MAG: trigger factor [Dehalococcoidales bacterium]|nr:trigger factor [Dehalococcoidales bacterium]
MKVTRDKVEDCQAFLTVEMESADMDSAMEDAYQRLSKQTTIQGFRKGKAPRAVVERNLGKGTILEEAIDKMLPQAYEQAVTEQEIKPYAQPSVEVTQMEPLTFKVTIPLVPSVELGAFKDVRLEPEKLDIKDENIDNVMEELRHQNASWEPVERELAYDDMAVIDILGDVDEKPYVRKVGAQMQVLKDAISPAPGFSGKIIGMKKDDEMEFTLPFPEDYPNENVAGKEGHFRVKLSEIKEEKLPGIDDEFAALVSPEFKKLDDLREEIVKTLTMRGEENIRMDFEERVINAVIEQAKVEYPPIIIDMEIDRILNEQERQLSASGRGMGDYLANLGKTAEQMREDLTPIAKKNIAASLVMGKVAEIEEIKVTDEDIENGINNMCKNVPDEQKDAFRQMLDTPQTRQSMTSSLRTRKTIEHLTEIARTEDDKPKTREKPVAEEAPETEDSEKETKEEEK